MSVLAAWLLLRSSLGVSQAETVQMSVLASGKRVGEARFERLADGIFHSNVRFTLGRVGTQSVVDGQESDGGIGRYKAVLRQGTVQTTIAYAAERLVVRRNHETEEFDYTLPSETVARLHPQLTARFLGRLSGVGPWRLSAWILDSGLESSVDVSTLPPKTVRGETVRRFRVAMGASESEYDLDEAGDVVGMEMRGSRLRFVAEGWESVFDVGVDPGPDLSKPTFRVERLRRLRLRMRDGVALVADVVRPVVRGRWPVILQRTPFGRAAALAEGDFWASRGYAYVAQDCRGKGDSEGTWDPFVNEGRDGFDTIAGLVRQSWCDGNVGMLGQGYAATAAWQTAVEAPRALRGIAPEDALPDATHGTPYEGGTFNLEAALRWGKASGTEQKRAMTRLPMGEVDRAVLGRTSPTFQSWLRREADPDWPGFDYLSRLTRVAVPVLHFVGSEGTLAAWEAGRRAGKREQWLVFGPTDRGTGDRPDPLSLRLRFFDTYMKGLESGMDSVPRVQAYVAGANRWVSLDGWPSSTSNFETLYLGKDALVPSPGPSGAAVYVYDPSRDRGHGTKETFALFKSAPFAKPTAIAGPFECRLFFKSGARDTDLFATLLDLAPNGTSQPIGRAGRLRATYRNGLRETLVPGRIVSGLLRPGDAARELAAGHRLGLKVSSSLFPEVARNLGTDEPLATAKRGVPQRNAILTGTVTPSRITFRRLW